MPEPDAGPPADREPPPGSPFALLSAGEARAWFAYMKLDLRLRYEMDRQLKADAGLSLPEYDVLVALTSEPGGRMQVSALAARIGSERSRVSHQVRRLQERGLVTTEQSATDRRATDVVLGDQGWAVLREASPGHVELVRAMFLDALSPEALARLATSLEEVYEKVIEHGTMPRPADHP